MVLVMKLVCPRPSAWGIDVAKATFMDDRTKT